MAPRVAPRLTPIGLIVMTPPCWSRGGPVNDFRRSGRLQAEPRQIRFGSAGAIRHLSSKCRLGRVSRMFPIAAPGPRCRTRRPAASTICATCSRPRCRRSRPGPSRRSPCPIASGRPCWPCPPRKRAGSHQFRGAGLVCVLSSQRDAGPDRQPPQHGAQRRPGHGARARAVRGQRDRKMERPDQGRQHHHGLSVRSPDSPANAAILIWLVYR